MEIEFQFNLNPGNIKEKSESKGASGVWARGSKI
jgi:hypothetical protein